MSFWRTHQFKKLNAKWRQKLEKLGFSDLEDESGNLTHNSTVGHDLSSRMSFRHEVMEEVRDYYMWAEDMAHHARFKSTLDKKIWILHAQGKTTHEIAEHVPVTYRTIARKIPVIRDYLLLTSKIRSAA